MAVAVSNSFYPRIIKHISRISTSMRLLSIENNNKYLLSPKEWKERLTHKEYQVLRNKDTEVPNIGEYTFFKPKSGYFVCKGCDNPLYLYKAKFESGCG